MGVISLVYISFATQEMSDDDLMRILTVSRENNSKNNITGMLLYREGFFIQALEGEEDTVIALYNKIAADPRHRNVILIYKNEITERTFSSWAMGFNRISAEQAESVPGFTDFLKNPDNLSFFTASPGRAGNMLEAFKEHRYL